MSSGKMSTDDFEGIVSMVEDVIKTASQTLIDKKFKIKSVELHHEVLMQALKEVLHVNDMPKPPTNFESSIEAMKRDRPAQPSVPDSLIASKLYLPN